MKAKHETRGTALTLERAVRTLRDHLSGHVIVPGDPDYDQARTVFPGGFDLHPGAIVRVADDRDVARVVTLARETGVELAVRSGGHSGAGHATTEGGIVLDLSEMHTIDIDVDGRTAWAQTGMTAVGYSKAAATHGLATGFGDTGSVGIGGITLGGGIGYLVRKYGLTIDDLLAAEIVTADGELLHVDEDSHPDLFWAIRGGGGNFGVATRFRYRLHPVDTVMGGMLVLPATSETIASFIALAEAAPEDLSTIANVMPAPPMPFLPEERHGELVILAMLVHAGDLADGERALAPFRAIAEPLADMLRPMPYPEIYPPEEEGYHPVAVTRTMFVDGIDHTVADTILEHLGSSDAMMAVAQLRVLGGAMARVPDDATAFSHRARKIMVNVAAVFEDAASRPRQSQWAEGFHAALRTDSGSAYVGFLTDEGPERIREAYPGPTWDRLASIKARYDPTNMFRLNQNIPPAERTEGADG
jgi:FAD/FMN-containing dehydrogenase